MTVPVIIIGAGGHARVMTSCLNAIRREIIGILHPDTDLMGQFVAGICIIGDDDKILDFAPDSVELVNGIGSVSSTEKRKNIYMKFKNNGYSFATIVHPSSTIMEDVQLGEGVQVMAGAVIQTGCVIGENSIVNTGAIIDHNCIIGEHVHVAPGAVLSGGIQIGAMTHIGTSATIIQGVEIGQAVIVGAGAVVTANIPSGVKVLGVPAKIIVKQGN